MAIEAPISKFRLTNLKIYILACVIFGVIFAYDGYLSKYPWSMRQAFYEKHKGDSTMRFNQIVPLVLAAGALAFAFRLSMLKNIKLVVDDEGLLIDGKTRITFSSIEKIDKTHFNEKGGFFIITFKDNLQNEQQIKLSDNKYDNLSAVLELLVKKIS